MRTEALLTSLAVTTLLVTASLAIFIPGFISDPGPDEPPARLDVTETTITIAEVTTESATFEVTSFVRHQGGPAENVSVRVQAKNDESGLVADSVERDIGTLEPDGERAVDTSIAVPREGSYVVKTILYVDGDRVDVARATVSGVEALTPPHAKTSIEFHDFYERPSVEYTIESVDDGNAILSIQSYLTNTGDSAESGLRLEVTARQADSNVVATRADVSVGSIKGGRTATTETILTVPDGYNYYLDVVLWRDGVVLDTTRAAANLDPPETLDVDETRADVAFEASDFESETSRDVREPVAETEPESQPGFGVAVAVGALVVALVTTRRWSE